MQNFFEMLKHRSSNYEYLVVGKGHLLDAFIDLIRAFLILITVFLFYISPAFLGSQ